MPNELKLRECPFCGETPKFISYGKGWCVECRSNTCFIAPETVTCATKEEAAKEWNRRANDEQAD